MKVVLHNTTGIHESRKGELNDLQSWVSSFAPKGWKTTDFKILESNLPNNALTHAGLIYYLHACWAKELGCILRPDMIYFTILSEIASCILKRPKEYQSLFTDQDEKQNIILVDLHADQGRLDIRALSRTLRQKVVSKELHQLVCETEFMSDDPHAREIRCMTFCQMGVPYYNYMTTFCGITSIDIQGLFFDWKKLFDTLGRLRIILSKYDSVGDVRALLDKSFQTVSNIIHFVFDQRFPLEAKYSTADSFWNNLFHYGANTQCGSGHDRYIVSGWARNFYLSGGEDLNKFSCSMTYVPYTNIETQKKFIQVSTLAYSELINGTAIPHYGKILFQILDDQVFNQIAMKKDPDTFDF